MTIRLAADVGGTNTRIALFDARENVFRKQASFLNCDYTGLEDVIANWLDNLGEEAPTLACIAIAAIPSGDKISMTNLNWSFSCKAIAKKFGFKRFRWINDFEANAFSLPHLTVDNTKAIHAGSKARPGRSKLAVIGPGTGLGGATLETLAQTPHACPCEPGHMSLAPANDLEIEILRILLGRYTQVNAELLVSGPGLLRLYKILEEITGHTGGAETPADVSHLALEGSDATAVLALNTFCALLGSVAGDFSLASGAYGGLFLAGGIVPTMIPYLRASDFHQRFCDKGALEQHLRDIPIYAITGVQPGLIGAAHAPII